MRIANVTLYILILWWMYGCFQNLVAYEFKIIHVVIGGLETSILYANM
jgi:hypothetical protein